MVLPIELARSDILRRLLLNLGSLEVAERRATAASGGVRVTASDASSVDNAGHPLNGRNGTARVKAKRLLSELNASRHLVAINKGFQAGEAVLRVTRVLGLRKLDIEAHA